MARRCSRKRRGGEEGEPVKGAPDWVVTFADMISLLVTFFVLLMTFSSLEEFDLLRVRGLLDRGTGPLVTSTGTTEITPPKDDLISATDPRYGAPRPHSRPPDELPESVDEGRRPDPRDLPLEFDRVPDGLRVRFSVDASFAPGSARPNGELRARLLEFADVMRHYPFQVVVEGHTDDLFRPTSEFPDASSLALARASACALLLVGQGGLEAERILLGIFAAEQPLSRAGGVAARQLNRRIELRIVPLTGGRFDSVEAQRALERTEGRR